LVKAGTGARPRQTSRAEAAHFSGRRGRQQGSAALAAAAGRMWQCSIIYNHW